MLRLMLGLLATTIACAIAASLLPRGILGDAITIVGAFAGIFAIAMIFLCVMQAVSPIRDEPERDDLQLPVPAPPQRRRAA